MNSIKVGVYSSFGDKGSEAELDDVLRAIKEGEFKESIEKLRNLRGDAYDAAKRKLQHFTPSGLFGAGRRIEFLKEYVPVIILDVDHLGFEAAIKLRNEASLIPYSIAAFLSPGGEGVKILVLTDAKNDTHLVVFNQVASFYEKTLNIKIDPKGKDISRTCFFSYDPAIQINENPAVFKSEPVIDIPSGFKSYQAEVLYPNNLKDYEDCDDQDIFDYAVNFTENIEYYHIGNRNNFIYKLANNLNRYGMNIHTAERMICAAYTDLTSQEIRNTVKSAYRNWSEHNLYENCSNQNNYHPLHASDII